MTKKPSMLSTVTPWDTVAEGYSEITVQLFQEYADEALALANLDADCNIVDIACGPGTLALAAAKRVNSVNAIDFSPRMVEILRKSIDEKKLDNVEVRCGDAQHLPYENGSFDAAFSMFGLMFFPDRQKGYAEIYRTLKPGGRVVISSWAPVSESPAMIAMFGAIRAMNPEIPEPRTNPESLENRDLFETELADAGFEDVAVHVVARDWPIHSVEGFWNDMVKGSAPILMMKNSMPEEAWSAKNRIALDYLRDAIGPDATSLSALALLGYGRK